MTPAELDALINGLRLSCDGDRVMCTRERLQAAAAITELRAEVAMEKAFSDIELQTCIELRARAERAEAERNEWKCEALVRRERIAALEAERADLIKINNGCAHEWDAMREERDALKQDAERYRWLRDPNNDTGGTLPELSGVALDAAIDERDQVGRGSIATKSACSPSGRIK